MPLILDAFNVLHAWKTGPARGTIPDLRALGALTRRPPFGREQATLVCDGPSPDPDDTTLDLGPGVSARFAGPGRDADSEIERMIAASNAPARLTVVSSDRRIEKAARRRGCPTLTSEQFIGLAMRAPRDAPAPSDMPPELDHREIEDWMKRFDVQMPEPPRTKANAPIVPRAHDGGAHPRDPGPIDPGDLDMERWLREYPPPPPGMERRPGSD